MKDYETFFKGKRVTLMGLGLLGRGVGDARFLAEHGAEVIVSDVKSEAELADSVAALKDVANITLHLGGHDEADFTSADLVIHAAGVPKESPYLAAALSEGVPIAMSTSLAARFARAASATIVGVTGTRGKSTVTHMIHHSLTNVQGNSSDTCSHIGGNIRGVSTLSLLPDIKDGDILVLELDSWQLQGFGYEWMSPQVAVFTNLYPDHLNYYSSMQQYFADKANIFKFQSERVGDTLIVGEQAQERVQEANPPVEPIVAVPIPSEWQLKVPGVHNRENAALAREALAALGMSDADIQAGLESFTGVEGRLEYMGETKQGVKIYNDNNATTPEATLAALNSLEGGIILIAGGTDKGLELDAVASEINTKCTSVHLLAGTGTSKLAPLLQSATVHDTFTDTIQSALANARAGTTILFSPLFASFGEEFANEYDRNDQFKELISKYYD